MTPVAALLSTHQDCCPSPNCRRSRSNSAAFGIAGLDVDDAELVVEELLVVVGVQDLDRYDGPGQVGAEDSVEKMDQQVAVGLGPEQGLEDAVDLGIDTVAHAVSLVAARGTDKRATARRRRIPRRSSGALPGRCVLSRCRPER